MKNVLIGIALIVGVQVSAQEKLGKVAKLRAEKQKEELKEQLFYNDEDFKVTKSPEKWNGESAVVLCQKFHYSYVEKGGNKFVQTEISRRRILINDDAALKYYSIYYYKHSIYEDNQLGINIIKPDGTEIEVDLNDAVDVGLNEIPESYRSFTSYGTKFKKLAIPNLEKGDILDYYQVYNDETKPGGDYEFSRFAFTLNGKYPVLKQKFFFNVDEKFKMCFRSFNGAPKLMEGDAGINRRGKTKEEIKTYYLEDDDREKYIGEHWKFRFLEEPTIKFQVFYVPPSRESKVSFFIDEEDGLLDTEVSKEEIRKRLKNNDGILSGFLSNTKFDVEIATHIKRYHKDKSKMEKVEIAYYYMRYKHLKSLRSLFSYSSYKDYDVDQMMYVDDVLFSNTMAKVLDKLDIEYNYIAAVERDYGSFSNIVSPHELTVGLKVDDQYIFAFSQYSNFNRIPEDIRGSKAILYKDLPSRYKEAPITDDVIPESNYQNHLSHTEQQVSFDEDFELITMNEINTMTGYQRDGHISFILKGSEYDTKDARRYNPRYAPPVKRKPRGNKVRIAEQLRKEKAEAEKAKKERYEDLKKYHNAENYEVDEYINFELLSDGRFTDSTALQFKEEYTLKGFINKAGRNYSFNVGHLIGGQFQLDEEDMERVADIHMYHGKGYVYDITVELPEGYTVEGLDQLTYNVDNSMGAFIATAKLEGNKLIIKTEKYYKTPHASKSEWPKMIEFLEAAYEFSQKKVILKKG